jgi:hypothetical protein
MNKQSRLYKQDFRPFYKIVLDTDDSGSDSGADDSGSVDSVDNWQRLPTPVTSKEDKEANVMQLRFKFKFDAHYLRSISGGGRQPQQQQQQQQRRGSSSSSAATTTKDNAANDQICGYKVFFAFCYPQSYTSSQRTLEQLANRAPSFLSNNNIYFHREQLTKSLDGRRVELLTITSSSNITNNMATEQPMPFTPANEIRALDFSSTRKTVFVSSRVHPGETPAQFVFDGFLNFLLSNDVRAAQLREQYVFKMVPMLNPDGVARGHYRTDSRGCNLNRFYDEPDAIAHPSIYAVKYYLRQHAANLRLYLDLHAHASKRGCFIYGNYLPTKYEQIKNRLYVKLISLNSPWFEYKGCDFSLKGMSGKDKRDNGLTKDGSGRVGIYKLTECSHCYTLECNYNEGLATNFVPHCTNVPQEHAVLPAVYGESSLTSPLLAPPQSTFSAAKYYGNPARMTTPKYNRGMFCNVGEACAVALLDMSGSNALSRVGGGVPSANPARPAMGLKVGEWGELVKEVSKEVVRQREINDENDEEEEGVEENSEEKWSASVPGWKWEAGRVGLDRDANLQAVKSGKVGRRSSAGSVVGTSSGGGGEKSAGGAAIPVSWTIPQNKKKREGRGGRGGGIAAIAAAQVAAQAREMPAAPEKEEEAAAAPPNAPSVVRAGDARRSEDALRDVIDSVDMFQIVNSNGTGGGGASSGVPPSLPPRPAYVLSKREGSGVGGGGGGGRGAALQTRPPAAMGWKKTSERERPTMAAGGFMSGKALSGGAARAPPRARIGFGGEKLW